MLQAALKARYVAAAKVGASTKPTIKSMTRLRDTDGRLSMFCGGSRFTLRAREGERGWGCAHEHVEESCDKDTRE